ncbi:class I SAM-dependent methyltransferase [Plantactinospora siamensis]|uniref:Class I SAM-dependent methyltransferase n=1 Tax=Plantactinospora siamensis TaxID=555372 RepID=A0ABV6NRU4_9ACTN
MAERREQRAVFGEAAEQYDAVRPGYPADLVADVLAYAGKGPAVEVGAGTGKATVAFAAHGLELTCLEPDPRMAAVLRRNCRPYPSVSVLVERFEAWSPDRRYGLLYSAQAWHWVDPDRRTDLAAAALAPGGALAVFGNVFLLPDRALSAALAEVDIRYGVPADAPPHAGDPGDGDRVERDLAAEWRTMGVADDGRFTDPVFRIYRGGRSYSTAEYLDLLASISHYRMLEPPMLERALPELGAVLDNHGGRIDFTVVTGLALARLG